MSDYYYKLYSLVTSCLPQQLPLVGLLVSEATVEVLLPFGRSSKLPVVVAPSVAFIIKCMNFCCLRPVCFLKFAKD